MELILWDVDGTLVWTGQATRVAFDRAVASVLGQAVGDHGVSFGGKTDPQIATEILSSLDLTDAEARRHVSGVVQALEREMVRAVDLLREQGRVLPGVRELLKRLDRRPEVIQSILTGNTEANARLKVGAFGLDRFLDLETGAYGSDSSDRPELVPIALERLQRLRNVRMEPQDVWIVGDTLLDLACARAAGARCLLVATGRVSFEELSEAGPDAAVRDLGDTGAVERLLFPSAPVRP